MTKTPSVLLLLPAFLAGACATPDRSPVGLELPRAPLVGPLPTGSRVLAIEVDARGRIRCAGKQLSPRALAALVARRKATCRERITFRGSGLELPRTVSPLEVVLHLDRRLPWRVASALRRLCRSRPDCWRLHFALRHRATGRIGAVAAFAPGFVGTSARIACLRLELAGPGGRGGAGVGLPRLDGLPGECIVQIVARRGSRVGEVLHWHNRVLTRGVDRVCFLDDGRGRIGGEELQEIMAGCGADAGGTERAGAGLAGVRLLDREHPYPGHPLRGVPVGECGPLPFSPGPVGNRNAIILADSPCWEIPPDSN